MTGMHRIMSAALGVHMPWLEERWAVDGYSVSQRGVLHPQEIICECEWVGEVGVW